MSATCCGIPAAQHYQPKRRPGVTFWLRLLIALPAVLILGVLEVFSLDRADVLEGLTFGTLCCGGFWLAFGGLGWLLGGGLL